eukprot:CAMPEP_0170487602 /NCGR_PEP_ID=MMETSP0208-20121228/6378_1 /TAXON_ID=197538 /ORGANISM="Strombidium inclinatum, Strain S3" /LENGTH=57 /DNA_ID=CAMNT_0010761935 /DNA_START=1120 /DNA_END=1293 /DNA_ORIENTATION=-
MEEQFQLAMAGKPLTGGVYDEIAEKEEPSSERLPKGEPEEKIGIKELDPPPAETPKN